MELRLKRLREALLITQQQLAKMAGVGVVTISRLERSKVTARFSTIHKLARALGVQAKDLVVRGGKR